VIILIIDENRIFSIEAKCEQPIPIHAYCPMCSEAGGQRMKLPSWNIHLFGLRGGIQNGKLLVQLGGVTGLNSGLRTGQKKLLDPLMPKAPNHFNTIVLCNVTLHNNQAPIFFETRYCFTSTRAPSVQHSPPDIGTARNAQNGWLISDMDKNRAKTGAPTVPAASNTVYP
jgi:hypothetical protein